jgi:hypothetical protein
MIYKIAGRLGLDPAPLSMRELFWMLDGRHDHDDAALRSVIAAIINTVSTKPVKPSDLVYEKTGADDEVMTEEQAKALFVLMGVCTNG